MNLLDTDIILEMLRERRHEVGAISIITLIEILRGLEARKRAKVKELLEESFNVQGLDNEIIEAYCDLYRKLREEGISIPDADLLIVATAISRNTTLKTGDEHFERLRELGLKLPGAPRSNSGR
ncbi:MAG: tRNA(fMet)-specific endonuclease VapC [Candidatus Bathyarchaeota archaeon BA2]|nr:MAG: tRNA(fMet)-specific endonuclease VapC [Candidatus Bathyarchaeota archaeon BA2]